MYFSVGRTTGGDYTWWLYSGNSQLVAWAGETFASQFNATRAATEFKAGAATARYEVYPDVSAEWRWRAWRSSDKVAASGESFANHANAQAAADNVSVNAGSATGL